MTDQEQRVAIAEACGFKIVRQRYSPGCESDFWALVGPGGGCLSSGAKATPDETDVFTVTDYANKFSAGNAIPEYLNDLNAIRDAEESVFTKLPWHIGWEQFDTHLLHTLPIEAHEHTTTSVIAMLRSTARQRAEAFLRTLGLWRDS